MRSMLVCAACRRHVFATEERCPFCGIVFSPEARAQAPRSPAPELSRRERYAIGAALALTLAGIGCSKEQEAPPVPEINVEATTAKPEPAASERPLPEPFEEPREASRGEASSSPFLVGSPAATPTPIETAPPPPTATVVSVKPTATNTLKKPPPPPPPPDDELLGGGAGWHRRGRPCQRTPNGQFVCPPYGCVFPDEACDVIRV